MKSVLLVLLYLFLYTQIFAQAKKEGDKFLGTWYDCGVTRKNRVSNCVIRRRGNEYTLQYIKSGRNPLQALFYKLKGDSLVGEDKSYGNVIFIPKTGHIKWKEGEFERSITDTIGGAPLDKK